MLNTPSPQHNSDASGNAQHVKAAPPKAALDAAMQKHQIVRAWGNGVNQHKDSERTNTAAQARH